MKDATEALMVAHTSDGRVVRRPLSPHLQVYRWPITMAMSILTRATGIALGVGCLLLTWWLVAAATSPAAFDTVQGFIGSPIGYLLMLGWTASLFFHFFSGIRYLVWDVGIGYDLPSANAGSYAVLAATLVLTLLTWVIGLAVM